jgi:adenylosuccinate lyase
VDSKNVKLLPLTSISPIDGRYWQTTNLFSAYFSEYALIKTRIEVEIEYLIFLTKQKIAPKIGKASENKLKKIYESFNIKDAQKVKRIEKETRHDVKAAEYFIADKLKVIGLSKLRPFLHFALTSDDINNVSYRLILKRNIKEVFIPSIKNLAKDVEKFSKKYSKTPMLARTHGQAAIPTTLGKEIAVFKNRLLKETEILSKINLYAKFGGAIGNWNAHHLSYPSKNWISLSSFFLKKLGLKHIKATTQTAPPEDITSVIHTIIRINLIVLDLDKDMWRYISDGWLIKRKEGKEIGSSTMPQKVNPINFENSEGNLEIANSIFETLARELPISRLQRDLSDSTLLRNIGTALAHSFLAYQKTQKGFSKIDVNKNEIKSSLNSNWNILFEALQTILRKNGDSKAYEKAASLARKEKLDKEGWIKIVGEFNLPKKDKEILIKLTPDTYIGYAERIAKL